MVYGYVLHVRQDRIREVWPIFVPDNDVDDSNIKKVRGCRQGSTRRPPFVFDFQDAIGIANKEARLRYLRDYRVTRLKANGHIHFWADFDPRWSCAITSFFIGGVEADCSKDKAHAGNYRSWLQEMGSAEG